MDLSINLPRMKILVKNPLENTLDLRNFEWKERRVFLMVERVFLKDF